MYWSDHAMIHKCPGEIVRGYAGEGIVQDLFAVNLLWEFKFKGRG